MNMVRRAWVRSYHTLGEPLTHATSESRPEGREAAPRIPLSAVLSLSGAARTSEGPGDSTGDPKSANAVRRRFIPLAAICLVAGSMSALAARARGRDGPFCGAGLRGDRSAGERAWPRDPRRPRPLGRSRRKEVPHDRRLDREPARRANDVARLEDCAARLRRRGALCLDGASSEASSRACRARQVRSQTRGAAGSGERCYNQICRCGDQGDARRGGFMSGARQVKILLDEKTIAERIAELAREIAAAEPKDLLVVAILKG